VLVCKEALRQLIEVGVAQQPASPGFQRTLLLRAQAQVAGGDFGDQAVGEPSPVSVLDVTNVGAQELVIAAAVLEGTVREAGSIPLYCSDSSGW
jgi:hypothetical protein